MSDDSKTDAKPKKKGGMKKLLLIGGGAILLIGGGVGAGLYAAGTGLTGAHPEAPAEDAHKPKLVLKEGAEGAEAHAAAPTGKHAPTSDASPDPHKYQATFYPIEQSFTSNLRDSDGFVQLGIGVSTFYDNSVIENLKKNDMPVRSAVLMTLADQDSFVITTPEGKKMLLRSLKDAINGVLEQREGFGGVDSVYFTSFIIQ
jgi:flagellar FliL protein